MEANPQTEKRPSNKEKKGFSNTTTPAGLFNAFALDSPASTPFPTPSGSAPQRVQTLERKLDLQKCLNRLKSDDRTLNNAFASAQQSIDALLESHAPHSQEKPQENTLEETHFATKRPQPLFDWKRVNLEISAWQKELTLLDQNRPLIQDKIKSSCQTIGSSLNTLEQDYRKAITDREQEKLNLTEQLGNSNLPYELVKEIREKIAAINQQEAAYFQNLNTTIFSAEALSKASKQLIERARQLTSETEQAIQTLKRQSISKIPKKALEQALLPSSQKTVHQKTAHQKESPQQSSTQTHKTDPSASVKLNQLSELLESIQQYRTEIDALKKDNHTLTDDHQKLRSEQVKNYQFSDHLKQDTDSLKCETEALRISNQLLNSDIKESRKENLQLSKQYIGQKADLITKKELKQLFLDKDSEDELRDQQRYEQFESNHVNLAQNIQEIECSLGQSLQDQSLLSDITLKLKDQTESSRCETQRLESEIQQLKSSAEELSSTLEPLKHSHDNQQEENRNIQHNLAQQQKTTEQQQTIIEKQNQKSQQLAERINEKLRSNSALAHQLLALKDNLNSFLETSKSSHQESTQTLQEQKKTNQSAIDLIERLEHNQQQQRHTQTALNQQLKTINQTIQDSEVEKQALTQSLKTCDAIQHDLLDSIQQANEVSGELKKAHQAQTKSLLYIDTQHNRADQLTLDLTELKLFAQNVVNKNRALTEDFSAQLTQIKNKTEQISDLEKTVLIQLDNTDALHDQNETLYKKSETLHQQNEALAEQLEQTSDQLGESHHQHQQLLGQQQQQLHAHQEQLQDHQAQRQEQLQDHQDKHQEQLQVHQNKLQEQHQDHQEQHQRQLLAQSHLQNQSTQLADDLQNQLKCVEISLSESSQKAEQLDQLYETSHTLNDKTNQLIDTQQFLNSESQRIQNETQSELEDIRTHKAELIILQETLEQALQQAQQQQRLELENNKNAYAELEQNHQQALQDLKTTKHQHQKSIQESRIQQQQTHKQLEQIQQIQQQYHLQVEQLQSKITETEKALKESRRMVEQTQESFDNSATVQQSYQHTIETFNQTQLSYIKAIDSIQQHAPPLQHQPSNQSPQHPQSILSLAQASLQPPQQDFHWEMPAANQNQAPAPWYKAPQGILLAVVLLVSLISSALVVLNQINSAAPPNDSIRSHLGFNPNYPTESKQTALGAQQTTELLQSSTVETLLALIMSNQSTPTQTKAALDTILERPESAPLHHWVRQELKSLQQAPVRSEQLGSNGFIKKQFNQAPSDHVPSFTWPLEKLHPDPASITYARFRQGITITAGQGHPIVSISDGKVIFRGQDMLGTGSLILIQHPDQYISVYGNSRSLAVALGEQVKKGQVIAQIGDHYQASAPSLYFEIRYRGNPEDPFYYFSNT